MYLASVKAVTEGYPLGKWIVGVGAEYERELQKPPGFVPYVGQGKFPFARKRLIDVFLYTQYAHQPSDDRTRLYRLKISSAGPRQAKIASAPTTPSSARRGIQAGSDDMSQPRIMLHTP